MIRRPPLRALRVPALVGAGSAVISWLFGVVVADATMIGLLVCAAIAVPRLAAHPPPVVWPAPPEQPGMGAWYDVRRLSGALSQTSNTRDVFQSKARPRLRELAEARLARYGVRWSDPVARRLLTPDVYDLLDGTRADLVGRSPVALTELVLDRLDEWADGPPPPQEGSR
ncbi:MAG TPA: hypothetical protein VFZ85_08680 [Jiangellaceae bacterium]